MIIAVIGGGGREHAIIKKLRENPSVEKIYALPGNGGIAADAECVPIDPKDIRRAADFAAENKVDFAVITPDDPLVLGAVDEFESRGIPCFGPDKAAARIEGSKSFAKRLMEKYGIPTAKYRVFSDPTAALEYVRSAETPIVIKADGLALGKGVVIARTTGEAEDAVRAAMVDRVFGDSGSEIVIEEFLEGPEVSLLAFTDGEHIAPMVSSMDHKRALDGDQGLNTGGMGTVAPNPFYTDEVAEQCMNRIFLPTLRAMREEGCPFRGCLYFGLMITKDGPKVIEYNCRFGDPETQVVLPLLETDLLEIMKACRDGTLDRVDVRFRDMSACCVIVASGGYPVKYGKGYEITVPEIPEGTELYFAGAALKDGKLVTSGGRVVGVSSVAGDLGDAVKKAYVTAEKIGFENSFFRKDIGARALKAL